MYSPIHTKDVEAISGIWDDIFSKPATLNIAAHSDSGDENGNGSSVLVKKEPAAFQVRNAELPNGVEFKTDPYCTIANDKSNGLQTVKPIITQVCSQKIKEEVLDTDVNDKIHITTDTSTKVQTEKSIFSHKRSTEYSRKLKSRSPFKYLMTSMPVKPHVCEVCGKSFFQKEYLNVHLRSHTNVKPSCNKYNNGFSQKRNLNRHLHTHNKNDLFVCDVCNKSFSLKKYLNAHFRNHSNEKPYRCGTCDEKFSQLSGLYVHRRTHTEEKPFKCEICNKGFLHKGTLNRHLLAHKDSNPRLTNLDKYSHEEVSDTVVRNIEKKKRIFFCDACKKGFNEKDIFHIHHCIKTEGTDFVCDVCSKTFSNKKYLRAHLHRHSVEKPFTCEMCNKGFANEAYLKKHRCTHASKQKRLLCDICNKKFSQKCNLYTHYLCDHGIIYSHRKLKPK